MRKIGFITLVMMIASALLPVGAQQLRIENATWTTNRDFSFRVAGAASPHVLVQRSSNLLEWEPLVTQKTATINEYTDTGTGTRRSTYYRALEVTETNAWIGDHITTTNGILTIRPINHASFVMNWNGRTIYNDPVGAATLYNGIPRADLILVSHEHGDHFSTNTLLAVRRTNDANTIIIAPRVVYNAMNATLKGLTIILTNGASTNVLGMTIEAVPAYNQNHRKGDGNGYVLTIGGKRLYMAGDTGAVEEMKGLQEIDVAFICMNVPFTMSVTQASGIVREFAPRIVYPYHYRNQDGTRADLGLFRRQLGPESAIEVRTRAWY